MSIMVMNVNNNISTSNPALNTANAPSAGAAPEAAQDQPSFASLLHRNQAPAPAAERKTDDGTQADQSTEARTDVTSPNAAPKDAGAPCRAETNDDDDSRVAADPALADWLAGLNLPAPTATPTQSPLAAAAETEAAGSDTSDASPCAPSVAETVLAGNAAALAFGAAAAPAGGSAPAHRGAPERGLDAAVRNDPRDATGAEAPALLTARTAADSQEGKPGTGADRDDRHAPAWTPVASASPTALEGPGFMPPAPALQPAQSAALPLAVALPTPLYAPDFPQALGAQLTLLAQGGVEHAELHLNPAEMGPVSVQIVVDGTQARIDFGADMAATRRAIESGLPELASALREAGLTLTGGGVSQHSRGRQDSADARQAQSLHGDVGDAARNSSIATPLRHSVRVGGIDAYA